MQDFEKTKEQLIDELAGLRSRVALLESREKVGVEGRQDLWGSREKLSAIFKSVDEALVVADLECRVIEVNDVTVSLSGYSKDNIVGQEVFKFFAEEEHPRARQCLQDVLAGGSKGPLLLEFTAVSARGLRIPIEASVTVMRDSSGDPIGFVIMMRDIMNRKRADEALSQSEERYRLVAENASDVIWIADINLKYKYVSPAIERVRGYKPEELIGKSLLEFLTPASADYVRMEFTKEMEIERAGRIGPTAKIMEVEATRKDGSNLWVEVTVDYMRDGKGNLLGILGITRDVSARKKAEEALKKSEEQYRDLVEQERDVIFSVDALGFITSINSAVMIWDINRRN